jgi:hypothetical protein
MKKYCILCSTIDKCHPSLLSEFARTAAKKSWTNPIVSLPVINLALPEGERTPPPSSLAAPYLSLCLPLAKRPSFPIAPRGVSPSIYLHPALLGLDPPLPPRLMPSKSPPSSSPLCESQRLKETPTGILPPSKPPFVFILIIELVLLHRFTYNIQIIFKLLLICLYLILW